MIKLEASLKICCNPHALKIRRNKLCAGGNNHSIDFYNLQQCLRQDLEQTIQQNFELNLKNNVGFNVEVNNKLNGKLNVEQNLSQNREQNLGQNLGQNGEENREHKPTPSFKITKGMSIKDAHKDCVSSICWPEDGRMYSGSWDRHIKLWDIATMQEITNCFTNDVITKMDFNAERNLVVSSHSSGEIRIWDFRTNTKLNNGFNGKAKKEDFLVKTFSAENWQSDVMFGDANLVVSSSYDGAVRFWDLRADKEIRNYVGERNKKVFCFDLQNTTKLVSGGEAGLFIWD